MTAKPRSLDKKKILPTKMFKDTYQTRDVFSNDFCNKNWFVNECGICFIPGSMTTSIMLIMTMIVSPSGSTRKRWGKRIKREFE